MEFKYSIMPFLKKDILKKCLIFNITIIVLTGIGIVAPDAKTHKTLSPDIWYSPLYYCILFLPEIVCMVKEFRKYNLVQGMYLKFNESEGSFIYSRWYYKKAFTIKDIVEFQINREIEDDYFQNYKITLNNGEIIQFTTSLKGVERVRDYIVDSGVKVTNGRWRLKDGYKW